LRSTEVHNERGGVPRPARQSGLQERWGISSACCFLHAARPVGGTGGRWARSEQYKTALGRNIACECLACGTDTEGRRSAPRAATINRSCLRTPVPKLNLREEQSQWKISAPTNPLGGGSEVRRGDWFQAVKSRYRCAKTRPVDRSGARCASAALRVARSIRAQGGNFSDGDHASLAYHIEHAGRDGDDGIPRHTN
jgi:hypothetical protein